MQWTGKSTASLALWRDRAPRYLVGGAWFFIVFTLVHLLWVVGTKWGDPAGLTTLYQTSVETTAGEETHRALGLAYDGLPGLLLALVQAGVVVTAAVFSTSVRPRRRRIGHAILVAWAALWMGDLMHLASIDHQLDSIAQATLLAGFFACTVYRAVGSGRGQSGRGAVADAHTDAHADAVADAHAHADTDAHTDAVADAPPSKLDRVKAVGVRAVHGSRRAAARVRERGGPLASAGTRRVRSGVRRLGEWLRTKGVIPATGRTG